MADSTNPPEKAPAEPVKPAPVAAPAPVIDPVEQRKIAARIITILAILGVVVVVLWVWAIIERHPRTDDAIVEANVIGVAPRVAGQIIKLNVQDNQEVKEGDVLFEIDPADYELALTNAVAALETLDRQIEVAKSQDINLKFAVKAAEAGVEQAEAQLKQTTDTLNRLQPLLPNGFATADDVDKAQTAQKVAAANLASAEQQLNQAKTSISALATLHAQHSGAEAAVAKAKLDLSYCQIIAPFPGRIINLNLSIGGYANVGVPVFSLLDTRKWYVLANYREGELRHIKPGSTVEVYLLSEPNRHFMGKVEGIGWAVTSTDYINTAQGVPSVPRELNWVHIAQRFPVRIEIEDPDPELFRMGATATAIIRDP